jgi:hypothetical protein
LTGRAFIIALFSRPNFLQDLWPDTLGDLLFEELLRTVDEYYSDASDTEEEEDLDSDAAAQEFWHKSEAGKDKSILVPVNEARVTLGLPPLKDPIDIAMLPKEKKDIRKAYYGLALQHHPDKLGGQNTGQMAKITEAYKYLLAIMDAYEAKGGAAVGQLAVQIHLDPLGLREEYIKGDGNCFYEAILDQLLYHTRYRGDQNDIRRRVAQLILDNQAVFQVYTTGTTLDTIVADILKSHSWNNQGGDFAPQLIATVLGRTVQIITPGGIRTITAIPGLTLNANNTLTIAAGAASPLTIVYDGHGHYNTTRSRMISS